MTIRPPILSKVTHPDSLAAMIHLDQAITLGSRNRMTDFEAYAPDIVALAIQLETLASNASRVELHSDDSAPVESMAIKIHGARRYAEFLTTARMMRVMLGRKRMLLSHASASYTDVATRRVSMNGHPSIQAYNITVDLSVKYFLQPLPFQVDLTTGQIDDVVAKSYIQECINESLLAELYRLSNQELCAIVMLGSDCKHTTALQVAKNLASFSSTVRDESNSLNRSIHCPLSLNSDGDLCSWYGRRLEDSSTILQSLMDFAATT